MTATEGIEPTKPKTGAHENGIFRSPDRLCLQIVFQVHAVACWHRSVSLCCFEYVLYTPLKLTQLLQHVVESLGAKGVSANSWWNFEEVESHVMMQTSMYLCSGSMLSRQALDDTLFFFCSCASMVKFGEIFGHERSTSKCLQVQLSTCWLLLNLLNWSWHVHPPQWSVDFMGS